MSFWTFIQTFVLYGYNYHLKSPVHISVLKFQDLYVQLTSHLQKSGPRNQIHDVPQTRIHCLATPSPSSSPSLHPASFPCQQTSFPPWTPGLSWRVPPSSHQKHCFVPLNHLSSHSKSKTRTAESLPDSPHSSFSLSFHSYH